MYNKFFLGTELGIYQEFQHNFEQNRRGGKKKLEKHIPSMNAEKKKEYSLIIYNLWVHIYQLGSKQQPKLGEKLPLVHEYSIDRTPDVKQVRLSLQT